MDSILIVSSSVKGASYFSDFFTSEDYSQVTTISSGSEARRLLSRNEYDIVLINSPLSDEFGSDLASYVAKNSESGVILIVRGSLAEEVTVRVENDGVAVVEKPINRQFLYKSVKIVSASRKRMMGLKNENIKLANKIEEMRLVDRAKCVLIQYLGMTEAQAHRHIEKQAMDIRCTKKEVALGILKAYET